MQGFQTRAIHAGELRPRVHGAVALPTFSSATFEYDGEQDHHLSKYIRLNNTPNHEVLHAKLANLEGGEAALVTASGMAAISTALLSVLRSGDHLLVQRGLYGGTHAFVRHDLPAAGVEVEEVDIHDPDSWASQLRPTTKAIYVESLSNPHTKVGELAALTAFAKSHGLVSLVDSTFSSPVNFRPIALGFDLVLHSGTKYLNGHGDVVAGVVVGAKKHLEPVRQRLNRMGGSLDPHACTLLARGMRTLGLRMERHNANALALASHLEVHPAVSRVHYVGLPSHPDHARAKEWFDGFGGVFSFELRDGIEGVRHTLPRLTLPAIAPSFGAAETLVTRPATTSHHALGADERAKLGITDDLVRVAVGLEDLGDLIHDFDQALADS